MPTDATQEYEDAKQAVSGSLLRFMKAADAVGRNGQVAMAEVLGTFMAAAEQAQQAAV